MSDPVEAQSLTTLINLFANPPQYPRNPTHEIHNPLVLYIVRVPGSKDVFLSPVKPPTKASIGLEAIQSSVYYFHVPTEEDEEVKQSVDLQRRSDEDTRSIISIARKPLPSSPLGPRPLPAIPNERSEIARDGALYHSGSQYGTEGGHSLRIDTSSDGTLRCGLFDRSSSLQQPGLYQASGDFTVSSPMESNRQNRYQNFTDGRGHSRLPSTNFSSFQKPVSRFDAWNGEPLNAIAPISNSLEIARRTKSHLRPITIIRRDPTSGGQWNVGTITQLEPTFSGSNLHPIAVELQTPGYGRFNQHPGTPQPGSVGSDVASIRRAMESVAASPTSTSSDYSVAPFQRIVDYRKMRLSDIKKMAYQRSRSHDYAAAESSPKRSIEKNVLAFTSPWQGTCMFVNGIDGRSFKIRHTIPGMSSFADEVTRNVAELRFNLSWTLLGDRHPRKTKNEEPEMLPIPKLLESKRENLRKGFHHLRDRSLDGIRRGRKHIHSRSDTAMPEDESLRDISNFRGPISPHGGRPYTLSQTHSYSSSFQSEADEVRPSYDSIPRSNDEELDEAGRLSLKLGRERAGGGFGGHSAKLGKLIIEDEGLKMCDLIVAAAMGIWWQHYEGMHCMKTVGLRRSHIYTSSEKQNCTSKLYKRDKQLPLDRWLKSDLSGKYHRMRASVIAARSRLPTELPSGI